MLSNLGLKILNFKILKLKNKLSLSLNFFLIAFYMPGDEIHIHFIIKNESNHEIKWIRASLNECIDFECKNLKKPKENCLREQLIKRPIKQQRYHIQMLVPQESGPSMTSQIMSIKYYCEFEFDRSSFPKVIVPIIVGSAVSPMNCNSSRTIENDRTNGFETKDQPPSYYMLYPPKDSLN